MFNPQAITGANVFIDGIGYFGTLKEATLPKFEHDTIEANGEIGKAEVVLPTLKPLSATLILNRVEDSFIALLNTQKPQRIYIKSNLSANGIQTGQVITFEGRVKTLELAKVAINEPADLTIELSLSLVKYELDKKTLLLYDFDNKVYSVNGKDLFENIRANIF